MVDLKPRRGFDRVAGAAEGEPALQMNNFHAGAVKDGPSLQAHQFLKGYEIFCSPFLFCQEASRVLPETNRCEFL